MAKNNRGKMLYRVPSRARGTCPVCLATRIKLLDTVKQSNGKQLQVCKRCSKASQQRIDAALPITTPIAYRRKHAREFRKKWLSQSSQSL